MDRNRENILILNVLQQTYTRNQFDFIPPTRVEAIDQNVAFFLLDTSVFILKYQATTVESNTPSHYLNSSSSSIAIQLLRTSGGKHFQTHTLLKVSGHSVAFAHHQFYTHTE